MKISNTSLDGVLIIEPAVFGDSRGWFMETYSAEKMRALGITDVFVQDNHSFSAAKGTVRGLHFQKAPFAQTKLVRCTKGSITDVAVDIRKGSPTFLKWITVTLSAENKRMLFIPAGFAHGFVTLEDDTEVQYKVDNHYSKEHDRSIRFDDPDLGVDWGVSDPIVSDKDRAAAYWRSSDSEFRYER